MWHQMVGAFRNAIDAGTAAAFSGPGDVVSGADAWWGLRGYNAAYATGSNPAIDVVDTATGLITTTVNITSAGALDTATILGLGYAVSVKKLYDQTGNGKHLAQATLANMPGLTLSGLGSLPIMSFNGTTQVMVSAGTISQSQPATFSAIANSTNTGSQQSLMFISLHQLAYRNSADNQVMLYGGTVLTATASDGSWHALQAVINGASSDMNVDGSSTTGAGGIDVAGAVVNFGDAGGSQIFKGSVAEIGYWGTAFTGTQSSNMSSNQHSYWGF